MMREKEKLFHGGVLRCCIETLRQDIQEKRPDHTPFEGEVLPCNWCKSSLIFQDGGWRWNREGEKERPLKEKGEEPKPLP